MRQRIISFIMGVMVLLCCFSSVVSADNNEYDITKYYDAINLYNKDFHHNIAITDEEAFITNICAKISPEDFYDFLIYTIPEDTLPAAFNEGTDMRTTARSAENELVKYYADIEKGEWKSRLNAVIETKYLSSGSSVFVRYVSAGYAWDDNWTTWLFRADNITCTEFSSKKCKVQYKGYWTIPASGLTDLVLYTYNITCTPSA